MSFAEEADAPIPVLPEVHSGIPGYLLEKAQRAKKAVFDTRNKPVRPRQRLPVVPQGVEPDAFFRALDELRTKLGSDHVEVNDKPLRDGWSVI
jgi:hypothetical protein